MKLYLLFFLFLTVSNHLSATEKITLITDDGCKISTYTNIVSTSSPVLIEVHGLGSNKEEFNFLNSFLEKNKINFIAVDLRGHGKSNTCNGKVINYKNFNREDWQNIIKDISATYRYIRKRLPQTEIILTGASIGANASLIFSNSISNARLILLSPGLNYAGLQPASYIKNQKEVLILTSRNDRYSYISSIILKKILDKNKINSEIIVSDSGHGVEIFKNKDGKDIITKIIKWIKNEKQNT